MLAVFTWLLHVKIKHMTKHNILRHVSLLACVVLLSNFLTTFPVTLLSFSAKAQTGYNELSWKIIREINWAKAGIVLPLKNNVDPNYSFKHPIPEQGNMYYRLKMVDKDYNFTYSRIISVDTYAEKGSELQLFPTVNSYGQLQMQINEPFSNLQVFNTLGQVLRTQNLQDQTGIIRLDISGFSKGTYIVVVSRPDKKVSKKFMVQ
jgi:hypothetical protein